MIDIAIKAVVDKLPVAELEQSLETFLSPLYAVLPDCRLDKVVVLSIRGIIGSERPVVTQMAQSVARTESGVWAAAKRIYRLLSNQRLEVTELSTAYPRPRSGKPTQPTWWWRWIRSTLPGRYGLFQPHFRGHLYPRSQKTSPHPPNWLVRPAFTRHPPTLMGQPWIAP
jgi:hypothetical protein